MVQDTATSTSTAVPPPAPEADHFLGAWWAFALFLAVLAMSAQIWRRRRRGRRR